MIKQLSSADLRALRVFQTICECGSFAAAEDVLNLSQSTISNHISGLVSRIGYSLCSRGHKGFKMTERGKIVMEKFSNLNLNIENFCHEVGSLHQEARGVLRVGILDHTITESQFSTINVIDNFVRSAPDVELHLVQDIQHNLHFSIVEEQLDLAIDVFVTGSQLVKTTKLYDELHHLYCGAGHPMYDIPPEELSEIDIEKANSVTNGQPPGPLSLLPFPVTKSTITATNIESIAITIMAGHHIGYLPGHFAEKYEKLNMLKKIQPETYSDHVDISIISKAGRRETAAMNCFRQICYDEVKNPKQH